MLEKEAQQRGVRGFIVSRCRRIIDGASAQTIVRIFDVLVQLEEPTAPFAVPFARHADENVRAAAASVLEGSRDPRAIDALVSLSRDHDERVRLNAVRAIALELGKPSEHDFVDTPAIRDALATCVDDECHIARNSALLGLAMRRDRRATTPLAALLGSDQLIGTLVDAAYYLAAPSLRDVLQWQLDAGSDVCGDFSLEEAIAACTVDLV